MVPANAIHPTHPVGVGGASVYLRPSPVVGLDTVNTSWLDIPKRAVQASIAPPGRAGITSLG